jgi:hypothetical protein
LSVCKQCEAGTFSLPFATSCLSLNESSAIHSNNAVRSLNSKDVQSSNEKKTSGVFSAISLSNAPLKDVLRLRKRAPCPTITHGAFCINARIVSDHKLDSEHSCKGKLEINGMVSIFRAKVLSRTISSPWGRQNHIAQPRGNENLKGAHRAFQEAKTSTDGSYSWCGAGNAAVYGNCIASSYKRLNISAPVSSVYPGMSISIAVQKMDTYNQVISTDSSSVLQVYPSPNSRLSILGQTIARMHAGRAVFEIAIKPVFAWVDAVFHVASLVHAPEIYIEGSDSFEPFTQSAMTSNPVTFQFSQGDHVCPVGYILKLDTPIGGSRAGTCYFCSEGTYSLYPLFGASNTSNPTCVPCPLQALQNGDCMKGGGVVNFSVGRWEVSDGIYRLAGCPPGHQMINSVGGLFSYQIQECLRCGPGQYILDSSNTNYSCQRCPAFLICNGTIVSSRYPAAEVAVDYKAGKYQLQGCPAGSAISPDGEDCSECPPLYYCKGGSAGQVQCPANTFSSAGANSSASCVASVFVNLLVLMPVSVQDFGAEYQAKFKQSVATAAKIPAERVIITSVTPPSTRRSAGVEVQSKLAAQDSAHADQVVSALKQGTLKDALAANGLPAGEIRQVAVGDGLTVVVGGLDTGGVAGVAVGVSVFVVCLAFGGLAVWLQYRKNESDGERVLRLEIAALRKRLGLGNKDGFYLSYEAGPLWRRRDQTVFILRNEMEAAAQLSLLHDFDVKSFDAFCHCLEYSGFVLHRGEAELERSSPPQYAALCEWLLETCQALIEPAILRRRRAGGDLAAAAEDDLEAGAEEEDDQGAARRRFVYFKRRVALARVWVDHGGQLWRRLKRVALAYMEEMAPICETRRDEQRPLSLSRPANDHSPFGSFASGVYPSIYLSIDRSIDRPTDRLIYRSIDRLIDRSIARF